MQLGGFLLYVHASVATRQVRIQSTLPPVKFPQVPAQSGSLSDCHFCGFATGWKWFSSFFVT